MQTSIVVKAKGAIEVQDATVAQWEMFGDVYVCADASDEAVGHDAIADIAALRKQLDAMRLELVTEPKRALAEVDAAFRAPDRRLEVVAGNLRQALGAFAAARAEAQRKVEAERRRVEQEQRDAEHKAFREQRARREQDELEGAQTVPVADEPKLPPAAPVEVIVHQQQRVVGAASTGGYKVKRTARIVDQTQVPDIYWRPSLGLIQQAVDDGAQQIAGVEIVAEHIPTTRRK